MHIELLVVFLFLCTLNHPSSAQIEEVVPDAEWTSLEGRTTSVRSIIEANRDNAVNIGVRLEEAYNNLWNIRLKHEKEDIEKYEAKYKDFVTKVAAIQNYVNVYEAQRKAQNLQGLKEQMTNLTTNISTCQGQLDMFDRVNQVWKTNFVVVKNTLSKLNKRTQFSFPSILFQ